MPWWINAVVVSALLALTTATVYAEPITLTGPAIGEDIPIELDNSSVVPDAPDEVSAIQVAHNLVLIGHRDWIGQLRPFAHLPELSPGDVVSISDGRQYVVRDMTTWNVDDSLDDWSDLVAPTEADTLTLVSCSGPFSLSRHLYLDRVVIHADRFN